MCAHSLLVWCRTSQAAEASPGLGTHTASAQHGRHPLAAGKPVPGSLKRARRKTSSVPAEDASRSPDTQPHRQAAPMQRSPAEPQATAPSAQSPAHQQQQSHAATSAQASCHSGFSPADSRPPSSSRSHQSGHHHQQQARPGSAGRSAGPTPDAVSALCLPQPACTPACPTVCRPTSFCPSAMQTCILSMQHR